MMDAPPALQTLGETVAGAFAPDPESAGQWDLLEATVQLISAHYRLDPDEVWGAVIALESEAEQLSGFAWFGHLLDVPWGFSVLGLGVAEKLLGIDDAHRLPRIHLSYH